MGLQCQYCHTSVEKSSYAGIPPTKTCMNCHAQIWTNAALLQPVRESWASGESLPWIKVHDLPDYVYFSHEIHVNKGLGCASCHGRVDQMPLMYAQNTLQMEWCLNCHRNPAKNLRPTSQIYNMAWEAPAFDRPVWCATSDVKEGTPTAQGVSCTSQGSQRRGHAGRGTADAEIGDELVGRQTLAAVEVPAALHYEKFTSQDELGHFLLKQYHIRTPNELSSCEVCHR